MYARTASTIVRIEKASSLVRSLKKDSKSVEEETEAIGKGIADNKMRLNVVQCIIEAVKRSLP